MTPGASPKGGVFRRFIKCGIPPRAKAQGERSERFLEAIHNHTQWLQEPLPLGLREDLVSSLCLTLPWTAGGVYLLVSQVRDPWGCTGLGPLGVEGSSLL